MDFPAAASARSRGRDAAAVVEGQFIVADGGGEHGVVGDDDDGRAPAGLLAHDGEQP